METYEALIERIQTTTGDERHEAFSELMNRFKEAANHWAFLVLEDEHLAQDAAQEAFIAAYDHIDQLREPAAFPGWLKQIVMSRCNRLTRRKHVATTSFEEDSAYTDPIAEVDDRDLREKVIEAVNDLPEHERTVTELFYVDGYSQREIAEQLSVPITTVKKRLQYAREHLRIAVYPMNNMVSSIGFDSPEMLYTQLDAILLALFGTKRVLPQFNVYSISQFIG
jgi:RNA polymerase sigma factor (sigma-70 family)